MLSAISAIGKNRELGKNNTLLWDIPEDMRYFRDTTRGKMVIMGQKTFESIGRPLPKRTNIVLTLDPDFSAEGIVVAHSPEEALTIAQQQRHGEQEVENSSLFPPLLREGGESASRRTQKRSSSFFPPLLRGGGESASRRTQKRSSSFFPPLPRGGGESASRRGLNAQNHPVGLRHPSTGGESDPKTPFFGGVASKERECLTPSVLQLEDSFRTSPPQAGGEEKEGEVFIIGGAMVYSLFLAQCDRLYLTLIDAEFPDSDVFFPEYRDFFREVSRRESQDETYRYAFTVWEKKQTTHD